MFVSVRRAKGLNIKGKNGELRHSEAITNMELFIVQAQMMLLSLSASARKNSKHLSKRKVKTPSGWNNANCKSRQLTLMMMSDTN